MNNDKEKNVGVDPQIDPQIDSKYKIIYHFAENSKININEILKKSFLLSLKAEEKIM